MTLTKSEAINLWLGCTTRYYFEDTVRSIKSIFERLDIDYKILDEDENRYSCCASTLWGIGLNEYAQENRSKVEGILKNEMGDSTQMISPCPGCSGVFKRKYELAQEPRHIVEFLFDNLDAMKFEDGKPFVVTYHDSCHLARGLGVIAEPRRILEKIPNLELKELSYTGENALCCGSGGGMRAYNKDLADSMSSLILEEAISLGSQKIVTACPFCERSFNFGREMLEADIEVKNLLSLVDEHLN